MRRREADEVRRLRASSQRGTRAALELPPGPLGVPARSWLTDRSAQFACATDRTKAGPGAATAVIGAPEGARVPQGTSHKDFALFGAPSPLTPRARNAPRQGARMPCSSAAKTLRHTGESRLSRAACSVPVGPGSSFRQDDKRGVE